jgi:hypothetical protein
MYKNNFGTPAASKSKEELEMIQQLEDVQKKIRKCTDELNKLVSGLHIL